MIGRDVVECHGAGTSHSSKAAVLLWGRTAGPEAEATAAWRRLAGAS
jgi:hypothetical protein